VVGNIGEEGEKVFDLARFADYLQRYPFEWPGLQAHTWVWCLHCARCFRFIEAKLDDEGLLMCGYAPDCDGSALDFWGWSPEEWAEKGQERPAHWPVQAERGVTYPLYA